MAISIVLESYGKDRYYGEKGQKICECCGAGMALDVFYCKTCGDVSEWKEKVRAFVSSEAQFKKPMFCLNGRVVEE